MGVEAPQGKLKVYIDNIRIQVVGYSLNNYFSLYLLLCVWCVATVENVF